MNIASCTLNLIQNKCIINDLHLLVAFHEYYLLPHFKFFQEPDPEVKNSSSFIARHVLVRFFLMCEDISKMELHWESLVVFTDYKQSLNELNDDEKSISTTKRTHFLRCVKDATLKYFQVWANNLLFLCVFSDQATARCIAQIIVRRAVADTPEYFCNYHQKLINVRKFAQFVHSNSKENTISNTRTLDVIIENYPAVTLIASGGNIWSTSPSPILLSFKERYLSEFS